ncbi:MAG: hypothetical protein KDA63_17310 [Planctomycetales bacterium]|nr:hypothetical protein [Planctomycetales bacterium]
MANVNDRVTDFAKGFSFAAIVGIPLAVLYTSVRDPGFFKFSYMREVAIGLLVILGILFLIVERVSEIRFGAAVVTFEPEAEAIRPSTDAGGEDDE